MNETGTYLSFVLFVLTLIFFFIVAAFPIPHFSHSPVITLAAPPANQASINVDHGLND